MAAVLAKGDTVIENAAREPEIGDVAECLVKMGAKIEGIHTPTLKITGVASLHGAEHEVIADRIETGTYAMAAAMTGGNVLLKGAKADNLESMIDVSAAGRRFRRTTATKGFASRAMARALSRSMSTPIPIPAFPPIFRRSSWR